MANNEIVKWVPKLAAGSASEVTNALKSVGSGDMRNGIRVLSQMAYKNGGKGKNALIASTVVLGARVLILGGYQIASYCKKKQKNRKR